MPLLSQLLPFAIEAGHLLMLSSLLFSIGLMGFLVRRHALVQLLGLQWMLCAGILAFLATASERGLDPEGQVHALFVTAFVLVQALLGLALLRLRSRNRPAGRSGPLEEDAA